MLLWASRAYYKKAGQAWGINVEGHILVNLRQYENETPLNSLQILSFRGVKITKKKKKSKSGFCASTARNKSLK